jgi:hypothetical protein
MLKNVIVVMEEVYFKVYSTLDNRWEIYLQQKFQPLDKVFEPVIAIYRLYREDTVFTRTGDNIRLEELDRRKIHYVIIPKEEVNDIIKTNKKRKVCQKLMK